MNKDTAAVRLLRTPSDAADGQVERFAMAVADEQALTQALEGADIVPQLLLQAQLSGDEDLLEEATPYVTGGWSFMESIPDPLRAKIRTRLIRTLKDCAAGRLPPPQLPSRTEFGKIMSAGIGEMLADDYAAMFLEEMPSESSGSDPRNVTWRRAPRPDLAGFHVVIIGAGVSGLCMAIKLRELGIPFTIYEKNDTVGGTWYENSYPGSGVDIPNHFYSFSFEPKHDWTRHFAKRDELWTYLEHCADKYDVRRDIRFGVEMTAAEFDENELRWTIKLRDRQGEVQTVTAPVLVTATGVLNRPAIPDIPGMSSFTGPMFHSAQWDHSVDLKGRRVALVGTGASSMQIGPTIADSVERLVVFQRSPHWAIAHPNYHLEVTEGMKWALQNIPFFAKWYRFLLFWASGDVLHRMLQVDPEWPTPEISLNAESHAFRQRLLDYIHSELRDRPDLIERVTPDFPPYGKRMLRDNNWYKMLKRGNVDLISEHVKEITADAVIDGAGNRHSVDAIILATGFLATRPLWPMTIHGVGGADIREVWDDDDPRAYLGITAPKFPNLFMLAGPNTGLSHGGSFFFIAECQVRYIMQCLRELVEKKYVTMECRQEPHDEYNRQVDEAHSRMVWAHKNVKSWYKNDKGRVAALSPWRLVDYWKLTWALNPSDYVFRSRAASAAIKSERS